MSTPNMAAGTDRSSHRFRDSETQFPVMTFQCLGAVLGLRLTVKKKNIYIYKYTGVSKNNGSPKSSHFNRVFHYFHHPFWGTSILGNIHINVPPFRTHNHGSVENGCISSISFLSILCVIFH